MASQKQEETEAEQSPRFYVDGKNADDPKLTFREERQLRDIIRELREDDEAEIADASVNEFGLALTVVVKSRDDEKYTLEQAFDLPIEEVVRWEAPKAQNGARPTRPRARKTS